MDSAKMTILARYPNQRTRQGSVFVGAQQELGLTRLGVGHESADGSRIFYAPRDLNLLYVCFRAMSLLSCCRRNGLDETTLQAGWWRDYTGGMSQIFPEFTRQLVQKVGSRRRLIEADSCGHGYWIEPDLVKRLRKIWLAGIQIDGRELFHVIMQSGKTLNKETVGMALEFFHPADSPGPVEREHSLSALLKDLGVKRIVPCSSPGGGAKLESGPITFPVEQLDKRVQLMASDLLFPGYSLVERQGRNCCHIQRRGRSGRVTFLFARWFKQFLVQAVFHETTGLPTIGEFSVSELRLFCLGPH